MPKLSILKRTKAPESPKSSPAAPSSSRTRGLAAPSTTSLRPSPSPTSPHTAIIGWDGGRTAPPLDSSLENGDPSPPSPNTQCAPTGQESSSANGLLRTKGKPSLHSLALGSRGDKGTPEAANNRRPSGSMNWARFSGSGAAFLERGSSAPSSDALRGASSASTPPPLPANAAEISAAAKTSRTRATKDQQNLNPERRRSRLFDVFRKAPARGSTFEVLDRQKGRDIAQQRATSSSVPALVNAAPSTAERDPVGMWDDQAFTADKTSGTNDPSEIAHPGLAMSPVSHVSSADSYTAMAPPVVAVAPAVGPDPQVPTPSNSSTLSATASTGAGDAIDSSAAVPPRMSSKQILADSEKSSSQSAQPDAPGVEETPAVPEPAEAVAPMASTSAPAAVETGKRAAATGKEQKSEAKAAAKPSYPPSTTKTRPALSVSMGRRWSGVKGGSGSGTSGKSASSPIVSPEGSQTGFNLRSFRNVRSDSQGGESSEQSRRYSSVSVDECMTPIDPDAPPLPVSEQPDSPEAGSIAARSPSPTTTSGRPISPMSSPQLGMPGLQAQASSSSISVAKFRQAAGMRSRPDLSFNVDEFGATSSPGSGSNVAGGISERRASTLGAFSSGGMSQPAGPSSWGGNTPRAAGGRTPSMELAALEAELSMSNRASPMLRSTPRDGAMFDGRRPRAGSSNSQILAGKGWPPVPSSGPNALGADLQALSRNGVNGSALSLGDAASSLGPAFSRPTSPIQNDISPLSEDVPSERPPLPEKDSAVTSRSPPDARLPNRATSPTPSTASRSRAGSRSTANGPFPRRVVSRQGSSSSLGYQGHLAAVRAAAEAASASFDALHGTQTPPEAYRQSMDSDRDHARTNGSQTPSGQTTRGQGIDSARFLARFQQEGKGPPPQTLLDALARLEQAEDGAGEDFAPPSLPWVPGHSRSSSSDSAKKRRSGSIDMISRRGVTEDGSMTSGRGWTDNMPSSHAKTPPDPPAKVEGLQASGIRANNPPGDAAVTAAATQVVGDMMPHAVERQIPGTRDEITVHVGAFHGADRETRVPHGNGDASALGFEPEPNGTTVGLASGTALDEFPLKPRCSANAVNGNEHKDSSAADTLLALASSRSASRLDNPSQDSLGAAGPSPREVAEPLRPETEALATRPVMEESAVKGLGLDQVSPTSQTPSDGLETGADSANTAAEVLPPAIGQSAQNEALARVASAHRSTPDLTLQGRARDGPTWPISMPSSRRASKSEQSPDESNRAQPALPPVGAAVPSPTRNGGVPSADAHVQPSPRQRTKSHSAQRRPSLPAHMPGAPVVSAATEKSNELLSFHAQQARAIASAQAQAGFPVQVAPMAPGLFGAPIGVDPRWFASLSPEQQWEMQQHHQQAAAFAQEQYRRYMATVIQGPSSSSSSSSRSRAPDDAWETATTPVNAGQHPNGHAQPGRLGRRATASAVGPNGRPSHGFRQPIAPHPGAGPSNSGEVMIRPYPTPSRAPVPSLSESARVSMGPSMSRPYHRSGHGHGHGHGQARGLPGSSSSTGLLRTPSARFMMPPSASQPSAGIIPDMPPMPTSVSGQGANGGHTDAHAHTGPEV